MISPDDYYRALIIERGNAEAAALLADDCRRKDAEIERLRGALGLIAEGACAVLPDEEECRAIARRELEEPDVKP